MASVTVDRTIENLDPAMKRAGAGRCATSRSAGGSFRTTQHNLARDVAFLMVQIDSARGVLHNQ